VDIREFFQSRGLDSRVEPDGCVFPAGNQAAEVRDLLVAEAAGLGVHIQYQAQVDTITSDGSRFTIHARDRQIPASRIILATGGLSWPQTGSTGDGYRFAAELGHTVIAPKPALVPLITRETWVSDLAGVSLADVKIRATLDQHVLTVSGNMLFTQRGIGGPAAQDLSRFLADALFEKPRAIPIEIDILPEGDEVQADRRLQQRLGAQARKTVTNVLSEFLPKQLSQTLCFLAGCDRDMQAGQFPSEKRRQLVRMIKRLPLNVTGSEPIAKATITRGGVSRDEIDPRTMESKIRPGLFFAGEVIDLDGPCGGYNLQVCWSTGALAGRSAARAAGCKTSEGEDGG
jgi:predicted Rossmann fold flavoprotein